MEPRLGGRASPRFLLPLAALFAASSTLLSGCADAPTALEADIMDPRQSRSDANGRVLQVTTVTEGEAEGPFSLRVGSDTRTIAPNDTVTIPRLDATVPVSLELLGVAPGCRVGGDNPREVSLAREGLTRTTFHVSCEASLPPSEAMIGVGGGTLGTKLPGGGVARLSIPAGALPGAAMIRITALVPEGSERARLRLEPAGLMLAVPATLTVELPEAAGTSDRVAVRWLGRASAVPTLREGNRVSAQLPFLGMPGQGLGAGGDVAVRSGGWRPLALFDPTGGGADEEAGVVTVDPQLTVDAARLLVLAVEGADSIITQDVRARILAALMLVVSTEDTSQFPEAVATICAAVDAAMEALRTGDLTEPRQLIIPLGRRALAWEGVFQAAGVTFDLPCRRANDFLNEIIDTIEARYGALFDAVLNEAMSEDRSFLDLMFLDLPRLLDLGAELQRLALDRAQGQLDAAIERLYIRAFGAARELCINRFGQEAFALLLDTDQLGVFPGDLLARTYREIQLCGTEITWQVLGEEGEVRGGGTATPSDAAASNLPLVSMSARYGDRLVVRGRLDVLRCADTRTQARGEQLVVRLTADGAFEDIVSRPPDGPGVSARFFPVQDGLELPLNDMAARASGEEGSEKSFAVRIFRESDGCDGVLVRGLDPAFGFVRTQLTLLPLGIEPNSLPPAEVGRGYAGQLNVTNGQARSTWELVGGNLPPGLELSEDGVVAGIPSELGAFAFEVRATSGGVSVSETLTIQTVSGLRVTTETLPGGTEGFAYEAFVDAAGGPGGDRTWRIVDGSLPAGLSIESLSNGQGRISGTPTQEGSFSFTVQVQAGSVTAERQLGIVIGGVAPNPSRTLQIVSGFVAGIPVNPVRYRTRLVSQPPDMTVEWEATASSSGSGFVPPGDLTPFITFTPEDPIQVDPFTVDWFSELIYPDGWRSSTGITIRVRACFFINGEPLLTNGAPTCLQRTDRW